MAADLEKLCRLFLAHEIQFIVIGGQAGMLHGLARVTYDTDLVYARNPENHARLVRALAPHHPYLRGAPPGLPFRLDEPTLRHGLNFTLTTDLGPLDLFGEVAGGGSYEELLPFTLELTAWEVGFRCVNLGKLIQLKRAAGRVKDFETIGDLEALREERAKLQPPSA